MHFSDKKGTWEVITFQVIFGFYFDKNSFATTSFSSNFFSGLYIMQIKSINYSLHFECVKKHKHLHWKVFSTIIYSKIFFNSLLLF